MTRICWTEPNNSSIRPGHVSVFIGSFSRNEANQFAYEKIMTGKINVTIQEI